MQKVTIPMFSSALDDLFEGRDVVSVTELADTLEAPPYLVRATAKQVDVPRLGLMLAINREDAEEIIEELEALGVLTDADEESDDDPDLDPELTDADGDETEGDEGDDADDESDE